MKPIRYLTLLLFLAPQLAVAQIPLDSVHVVVEGVEYPGYVYSDTTVAEALGPLSLVLVEGDGTTEPMAEFGCDPLVNAAEVEGNIALAGQGGCALVVKAENAAAAGAMATLVLSSFVANPDYIGPPKLCGLCPPYEAALPIVYLSYNSGQALRGALDDGPVEATIVPVRITPPPTPPTAADVTTDVVATTLFDDGFIGNDASFGNGVGFTFNGEQGLFVSSVLVGIDGEVTTNPYNGVSEFTALQDAESLVPPFEAPFQAFEQGARAVFSSPLGLDLTLTGYADADEPNTDFVVFTLAAQNVSGGDLDDVYVGLLADFDAGTTTSADDSAGFEEDLNLAYVFDAAEESAYFGAMIFSDGGLSGYGLDVTTADDTQLFDALTTENPPVAEPSERVTVVGVGPFDMLSGEEVRVGFALVAGEDEADLFANALLAEFSAGCGICPSIEQVTEAGRFVLETPYPNPLSERATVGFTLPVAQAVRLAVYDVLGREVAVLAAGPRPAGEQVVTFDAAGLGSGVYLVRLEAGTVQLTQRLTIIR